MMCDHKSKLVITEHRCNTAVKFAVDFVPDFRLMSIQMLRVNMEPLNLGAAPLNRETLNEQVYRSLKKAFLSGRFLPGQVVTLRGLAQSLGCSIMPIRDAISRLAAEQAFEGGHRVIRIPALTRSQSEDLWRLRILLEGQAAGMAAQRITEAELAEAARLNTEVRELAEAGDLHQMLDRNDSLQFTIYRAAHSDVLVHLIETLRMRAAPQCTLPLKKALAERLPFLKVTLRLDDQLLAALKRHEVRAAMRVKRADIAALRDFVFQTDSQGDSEAKAEARTTRTKRDHRRSAS